MKIKIYFHVAAIPGWKEFIEEKTNLMKSVGLWDHAANIIFELHYKGTDFAWIYEKFINDPKVIFWECMDSVHSLGESYSQIHLWQLCQYETEPVAIFRYHTKGLRYRTDDMVYPSAERWAKYLDYWNIEMWRSAYLILKNSDYDTVGANWHDVWENPHNIEGHWSGNIWWANSEYIKRIPPLRKPHEVDCVSQLGGFATRHDAELWIGIGKPKFFEFHHFEHAVVNYGIDPPDPKDYRLD
jgi:hypothetical protein